MSFSSGVSRDSSTSTFLEEPRRLLVLLRLDEVEHACSPSECVIRNSNRTGARSTRRALYDRHRLGVRLVEVVRALLVRRVVAVRHKLESVVELADALYRRVVAVHAHGVRGAVAVRRLARVHEGVAAVGENAVEENRPRPSEGMRLGISRESSSARGASCPRRASRSECRRRWSRRGGRPRNWRFDWSLTISEVDTPNTAASFSTAPMRGFDHPVSHCVTVERVTPTFSASCSCVQSRFMRRRFMFFEIAMSFP